MTDYLVRAHGIFPDGQDWSTKLNITSNQNIDQLLVTMRAAWTDAWTNGTYGLNTLYPTETVLTSVSVASLGPTMRQIQGKEGPAGGPGTAAGDTLPIVMATTVKLLSDYSGGSGRGRMKLPAMEETMVNGNLLIGTAATRVKASITALFAAIRADGSSVFVYNKDQLKDLTPPFRKRVITQDPLVNRKPGTQRNRAGGTPSIYV